MDNLLEELKEKLSEIRKIIDSTTEQKRQQRGKTAEDKEKVLNEVKSKIFFEFKEWFQNIGILVSKHNLYYNVDLLAFINPPPKLELEVFSDIGGFIDEMENYYSHLEDVIELFEHRDAIGMARDFKIIEEEMALTDPDYAGIIDVIYRYGIQMSRTVDPYFNLDEEPLRFTILNALNVIYKGLGSGETFNKEGKTDICIRVKDINIFVAECKVLHRPVSIDEGLEQLLIKYTTTYDDKVALIVFNKNYDSSVVVSHAEDRTDKFFNNKKLKFGKLPLDVKDYKYTLRYKTTHPLDNSKTLILTVVVINIQKSK